MKKLFAVMICLFVLTLFGAASAEDLTIQAGSNHFSFHVNAGEIAERSFTVPVNGVYTFTSDCADDTIGYLYDAAKKQIATDDDSGPGNNFCITAELAADTTYYIGVKYYRTGISREVPLDINLVNLSISSTKNTYGNIPLIPDDDTTYTFTAPYTGDYAFYSTGSEDTFGYLYASPDTVLINNDDSGESYNFRFTQFLTAGTNYTIGVRYYNGGTGGYTTLHIDTIGILWNLKDGTLNIFGEGPMQDYSFGSPTPWYDDRNSIHEIQISSGITRIGDQAFSGLPFLRSVTIPDSVTAIGSSAFGYCPQLSNVRISKPEQFDLVSAFTNTPWLENHYPELIFTVNPYGTLESYHGVGPAVVIPDTVRRIEDKVFYRYTTITSVTIPASVTELGSEVFSGCSSLTSVTLPDTITYIPNGTFRNCGMLSSVTYCGTPLQKQHISIDTFLTYASWSYYTEGILQLPDDLKEIQDNAFAGCPARTIIIPAGVTTIGANAFANCPNLKQLYFIGTPSTMADSMLSGCSNVLIRCHSTSSVISWGYSHGFSVSTYST